MGEVSLTCFFISPLQAIFVIGRLVGPFSEKCDRGLKNTAIALRPRAVFSNLRSLFFSVQTYPEPFFLAVDCLTSLFKFISNYFMLGAFSSPVKFSKIVFFPV